MTNQVKGVNFELKAEDKSGPAFDSLKRRIADLGGSFGNLSAGMGKIFAVLTGGALGAAFGAFMKQTIDAHEEINKLSQKLGLTVSELSKYKYALGQADVSLDSFGQGVKDLSRRMVEATDASSKAGRLMAALGVDLGGGIGPAVEKIADAFAALPDGTTKAALAVELFGKSGMEMIPFLNQGAAGIKLMKDEAARLGLVMDQDAARSAEEFNDNLKTVGATVQGLGISLFNQVARPLADISRAMKHAAEDGGVLMAALVGIGGALQNLFMGSELSRLKSEAADLERALDVLAEQAGQGGVGEAYMDGLIKQMEPLEARLKSVRAAIDSIVKPPAGAAGVPQEDPRIALLKRQIDNLLSGQLERAGTEVAKFQAQLDGVLNKIYAKDSGLDSSFAGAVETLSTALIKGKLPLGQYEDALARLLRQQPFWQRQLKTAADLEAELAKDIAGANAARGQELQAIVDATEQENFANITRGMTRSSIEELIIARMEERLATLRTIEGAGAEVAALEKQIEARGRLRDSIRSGEGDEASRRLLQEQLGTWRQIADVAGDFFSDLVMNGRSAFRNLGEYLKGFARDMVALFAKRWILQLGATAMAGTPAGSALAQQAIGIGGNSLVSTGASWLGEASGATAFAANAYAGVQGGYIAQAAFLSGGAETAPVMGTIYGEIGSALASMGPYGWIALAVVAVAAWLGAKHKGGPKVGGSYMGNFGADGSFDGSLAVPGTDNGRFFTPNQGDEQMRSMTEAINEGFHQALTRFGGTTTGMSFGLGFDHDPHGTADSRVSSMVLDSQGRTIYRNLDRSMDDKEVPAALQLEGTRMVLAALQASQLPPAIAAILKTVDAVGATAEQIGAVFALADAFQTLTDSLSGMSVQEIIAQASKSATLLFQDQGTALLELANKSEITVQSLQALTGATQQYQMAAAQLILGFENAKRQISEMFGATSRSIQLAGMDPQEQFNFYQREAERLLEQALGSNSADEIQRLAGLINQDLNAAFSLLSPGQQANAGDWIERIERANAELQARLAGLQEQAEENRNAVLDKVEEIMTASAAKLDAAATKIQEGGADIRAGADHRLEVDIKVRDDRIDTTVSEGG